MASSEEGRLFAVVGSPGTLLIAEASPRCGGEASVVRAGSVWGTAQECVDTSGATILEDAAASYGDGGVVNVD